jgi:predicted helicase
MPIIVKINVHALKGDKRNEMEVRRKQRGKKLHNTSNNSCLIIFSLEEYILHPNFISYPRIEEKKKKIQRRKRCEEEINNDEDEWSSSRSSFLALETIGLMIYRNPFS